MIYHYNLTEQESLTQKILSSSRFAPFYVLRTIEHPYYVLQPNDLRELRADFATPDYFTKVKLLQRTRRIPEPKASQVQLGLAFVRDHHFY